MRLYSQIHKYLHTYRDLGRSIRMYRLHNVGLYRSAKWLCACQQGVTRSSFTLSIYPAASCCPLWRHIVEASWCVGGPVDDSPSPGPVAAVSPSSPHPYGIHRDDTPRNLYRDVTVDYSGIFLPAILLHRF